MDDIKAGMQLLDVRLSELEDIQRSMAVDLEAARGKATSTAEGFAEVRGLLAVEPVPPVPRLIALLRAVNVGGHQPVAMADLKSLLADLGFSDVKSLLQSGNLVFRADGTPAAVERQLQAETEKRLGVRCDIHVRSAAEWAEMVARNPFPEEAERDPGHLLVLFVRKAIEPKHGRD